MSKKRQITDDELPTVLAALRLFESMQDSNPQAINNMPQFAWSKPLSNDQIEQLCQRLNT